MKTLWFAAILLVFPTLPALSLADPCASETSSGDVAVLILSVDAGKNAAAWPVKVIPVLLRDYLSHIDGLAPRLASKKPVDEAEAHARVNGILTVKGTSFELKTTLHIPRSSEPVIMAGTFTTPSTLNDLLVVMTERIAVSTGKRFKEKKLLPYLVRSSSAESLAYYADGLSLLPTAPDRAVAVFRKALEKDYNFVPAYVALAEALARAGALGQAQLELMKARTLNPVLTKPREACIASLIKAGARP